MFDLRRRKPAMAQGRANVACRPATATFENRQGVGVRTHLASPAMAAAAAIAGELVDVRRLMEERVMQPFTTLTSIAAPLLRDNINH